MSDAIRKVSLELRAIADELEARIEAVAGERVAFSLFVWTAGRCNYISTAQRPEVIQVLEGMIAGWRKGMPDIPAHKIEG